MKIKLKRALELIISILLKIPLFEEIRDIITQASSKRFRRVRYGNSVILLTIPNLLNRYRAATFSSKEPETLQWIDSLPRESILWDVGANVGLYSIYAAIARNCRVYSFEPSVFNLETLARNINLNGLSDHITIFPLPLCMKMEIQTLNMTSMEWGGALSTFGKDFGHDGKKMHKVFAFQTVGVSMDDVAHKFEIPFPDYLKMDVDGLEHLILQGGGDALSKIKGILIEINDTFTEQANAAESILKNAGFHLVAKTHSDLVDHSAFSSCYNQIWER